MRSKVMKNNLKKNKKKYKIKNNNYNYYKLKI